ncbi:hypothetical protein QTO34_014341 [Cnephaeus nilssonii]|uniref:Peptidase A2 domain-containing protein n=1 Tax=Cnephaeus nilssonii TaxID=3371016 RepID=A0AA40I660_CNENI|nr:hypothetical protein QTO34_014341 [Eptesicus nilssonii]
MIGDGGHGQPAAGANRLPQSTIMAWISLAWVLPSPPAIFAGLTCIFAPDWLVGVAGGRGWWAWLVVWLMGAAKPMVRMKIGGQTVNFMVDMGAEYSIVTQKVAPLSGKEVTRIRATRDQNRRRFCRPCPCQLGSHQVIHEFLYLSDYPVPLIARDL